MAIAPILSNCLELKELWLALQVVAGYSTIASKS